MKSAAPLGVIAILLATFCSCSGPSDTAQIPEIAPVDLQATLSTKETEAADPVFNSQPQPEIEQPASIMARQLKDFGSEPSTYSGDSFFETQTSFEVPDMDQLSVDNEVDFSGNLISE